MTLFTTSMERQPSDNSERAEDFEWHIMRSILRALLDQNAEINALSHESMLLGSIQQEVLFLYVLLSLMVFCGVYVWIRLPQPNINGNMAISGPDSPMYEAQDMLERLARPVAPSESMATPHWETQEDLRILGRVLHKRTRLRLRGLEGGKTWVEAPGLVGMRVLALAGPLVHRAGWTYLAGATALGRSAPGERTAGRELVSRDNIHPKDRLIG
ncbi:hypothetical protein DXG03_002470 [Asterophora parasitica]|uniref:Uncharacterized protein n=1 Tax=Asterophora parasitica TaxID=117018 RepID=A0A9P7G210_9AGAR|nr:hypothetical protein DXG03_002470 [Asterophora parasitica]